MKIHVTRKHIKQGKWKNARSCPIALALQGCGFNDVVVGSKEADINRWCCLPLPQTARRFIERFDSGKPVKPFVFNLKLKETP